MSGSARGPPSASPPEWRVRLDCGHEIDLAWTDRSAAVIAGINEHRVRCPSPPPELAGPAWRAPPSLHLAYPVLG
ncbi:MAG TPA: hypothetical protein VML53_08060 [Thermoplasmata archaeon]|nr:hypothetical protein [Thermoplasmata archaeon]